jgi:hypothetical protein
MAGVERELSRPGGAAPRVLDGLLKAVEELRGCQSPEAPTRILVTGAELLSAPREPIATIPILGVGGLLRKGRATLLSAREKTGKSELIYRLAREWLDYGLSVLVFSEETAADLAERLEEIGGDWECLHICFTWECTPAEMLGNVREWDLAEAVIILDTYRSVFQLEDENDPATVGNALRPWTDAQRRAGWTLLISHHENREGTGYSGAHSLGAGVDCFLELSRVPEHERRRKLKARGRRLPEVTLVYEWPEGKTGFIAMGEAGKVSWDDAVSKVEDALHVAAEAEGGAAETAAVLAEAKERGIGKNRARDALECLCWRGGAERTPPIGEDAKGKRVKWRPTFPASPPTPPPGGKVRSEEDENLTYTPPGGKGREGARSSVSASGDGAARPAGGSEDSRSPARGAA